VGLSRFLFVIFVHSTFGSTPFRKCLLFSPYKIIVENLQGEKLDYDLKAGKQGHIYIPKRIREIFGNNLKAMPNTNALVIFSENTPPEAVIASLQVIISDLKLRMPARQEAVTQ
jgi:hypothetical protein